VSQHRAVVAVCTFRRNEQLAALVRRIDSLVPTEVPDGTVGITIVDDSPEGGAAAVIDSLRSAVSLELEYHHTAAANIAVARNRAIEASMARGEFVACLDDDCVPEPGWLRELLRVAHTREADIVVGHRIFFAPEGAPRWLSDEPFLDENAMYADESVPISGNTANVLIRGAWLAASGVRFRNDLGTVGGEDMVFFADAASVGANVRFAAGSVSKEPCDGRRSTLPYQWWRQLWLGNNEALINRHTRATTPWRLLLRGSKRSLAGVVRPFARLVRGSSPQWRWSAAMVARGGGLVAGVLGLRLRHHS